MNTVTIQDKNKRFTLTVRADFLEKCTTPSDHSIHTLIIDYNLTTYLHNLEGPAGIQHYGNPPGEELLKLVKANEYALFVNPEKKTYVVNGKTIEGNDRYEYWIDGRPLNRLEPAKAWELHHTAKFNKDMHEFLSESTS